MLLCSSRLTPAAVLVLAGLAASSAFGQATVPLKVVYREGQAIAGSTISSLNAPFTDGNGRMASVVQLADGRRVLLDENLAILFDSGTVASPTFALTGGEGTFGFSAANNYIYSPSVSFTPPTPTEDCVYSNGGLLLSGGNPAPGFAPGTTFIAASSRPTMRPDGTAQWVSTLENAGGTSVGRAIYTNPTPAIPAATTILIKGGDTYGGLLTTLGGIGFDYAVSDNGSHRIHALTVSGAPTTSDLFMAADDVLVAREGSPAPLANWGSAIRVPSINNSGTFVFAGDTTFATTTQDEVIVSNSGLVLQEGAVIGGTALAGTCNALSINNLGDVVFTWGSGATEVLCKGPVATLSASAVKLLQVGDLADTNNNGVGEFTVINLEPSAIIGPGLDLADDGRVFVEITLRPIGGVAADDFGAIVRFPPDAPPCVADVDDGSGTGTPDGGVGIEDLLYYLTIFEAGTLGADVDDGSGTGTPDGGVGIEDLLYYLTRFEAGC